MYRTQEFVERCMCAAPFVAGCASCGRARCALHLTRGLCDRCSQAIGRELTARAVRRWWQAWALGVVAALGSLCVHSVIGLPIGAALTVASYLAMRRLDRRRLIALMGPSLSASKGELLPPPGRYERDPEQIPPA